MFQKISFISFVPYKLAAKRDMLIPVIYSFFFDSSFYMLPPRSHYFSLNWRDT